ncbi:MAG: response regulator [Rhodocyclaceae bacterium]|nr:response regulator [Rhodocyclaceae bacterium]
MNDTTHATPSPRAALAVAFGLTLVLLAAGRLPAVKFLASAEDYLPLHSLLEFVSIAVSAMVFALTWNLRDQEDSRYPILGVGFLCVALIDFGHTLSYDGMPAFVTASGAEKAIDFWLAGRLLSAIALLLAALAPVARQRIGRWRLRAGAVLAIAVCALVYWVVLWHPHALPATFVPGVGLTAFKIAAEYFLVLLFAVAAVAWFRLCLATGNGNFAWLSTAAWTLGLAELFFTLYADVTDIHNLLGHVYKVTAYWMIYRGIFIDGVRRPQQQALRMAQRLDDILRGTNVGTWEWNVQTGDTVFNDRWAEIAGYTLAELAPLSIKTWRDLAHHDDLSRSNTLLKRHFSGELPYYECEARMRHRDGHWVWVLDRGKVTSWTADGKPLTMSGTHQDISQRKQLETELTEHRDHLEKLVAARTADLRIAKEAAEAASRAKTAFLSIASHELRTPMNGIMGTISLAMRRTQDRELLEFLGKAQRASKKLLAIINDVLDITRIEADRLALTTTRFCVPELLSAIGDALQDSADSKRLALVFAMDEELADQAFLGDPVRMTQILMNLVGNALKFTSAGSVTIRVAELAGTADHAHLRFEVEDTGIGIAAADLSRIFEPFEQVDTSQTRQYGGTGLGLALCRKLVEALGGDIAADSRPGIGSTFHFELPVGRSTAEPDDSPCDAEGEAEAQLARHAGARVLVVEDEPVSLEIVCALLSDLGLSVSTANDGIEGVARAQASPFDLILMDMNMPRLGGIDACHEIRKIAIHAETPIIALTANAFVEDRDRCLEAGMDDHITKPVIPEVLFETLARWLDKSHAPSATV